MLNWLRRKMGIDTYVEEPDADAPDDDGNVITKSNGIFSTHYLKRNGGSRMSLLATIAATAFQRPAPAQITGATDSAEGGGGIKSAYALNGHNVTDNQLSYFGSQNFIGYQLMAILAQNWLIAKACSQPAKDAIRNGFEITVSEDDKVPPEVLAYMTACDKRYNLTKNLVDFVYFGRMFGIRIAKFNIDSTDPEYYQKPFNPDGITPGSYKGITQIDPYWIVPELSGEAASNPDNKHFYEPTWWQVNGKRIHRTHLIIFKGPEVADILKPTYLYGGLSIPQIIFERVYAAERTANEAPMLAQSKRETVLHVDVDKAVMNQAAFEEKISVWATWRNNWGIKVVGTEEKVEQFETSLADLDVVIMTQYQLVASIAGVPVTKLLGTVPKGFNATGEYDESSYHEELESIQTHDLARLIERHHLCVMRSDVAAKFPDVPKFTPVITWHPLDAPTAKERAEVNKLEAEAGAILVASGAIDGEDERNRIIADPDSGYTGMASAEPELVDDPLQE